MNMASIMRVRCTLAHMTPQARATVAIHLGVLVGLVVAVILIIMRLSVGMCM